MPSNVIHDLWQRRKLSHKDAHEEVLRSRVRGCRGMIEQIDFVKSEEQQALQRTWVLERSQDITNTLGSFKGHPVITKFLEQYHPDQKKGRTRFLSLLLRGPSRCGKSLKASSLFGVEHTLCVNCQGVSPGLPSIRAFDRAQHSAILWDEADEAQVLNNKLVFQAGNTSVALSQSACNAFSYEKYLFAVPMILCSNVFSYTTSRGKKLSTEDTQWLEENVLLAELGEHEKWFTEA